MNSGIYRIIHIPSNRTYVGSSYNVRKRIRNHRDALNNGTHRNKWLQCSWNKYGQNAFLFESLLSCPCEELQIREQEFIDAYIRHGMPLFNMKPSAESRIGFKYDIELCARISNAKKANWQDKKYRERIVSGLRGHKFSPETIEKLRISNRASGRGANHCNAMKTLWADPAFREKMRIINLQRKGSGYSASPATRAKLSSANKIRWSNPEYKEKMRAIHRMRALTPPSATTRLKLSLAAKKLWAMPGSKERQAAVMRKTLMKRYNKAAPAQP